jgi:hypothetical protein
MVGTFLRTNAMILKIGLPINVMKKAFFLQNTLGFAKIGL